MLTRPFRVNYTNTVKPVEREPVLTITAPVPLPTLGV